MITQNLMRVEHFVRDGERWVLSERSALEDALELASVNASVLLSDIYEDIGLTPPLNIQAV